LDQAAAMEGSRIPGGFGPPQRAPQMNRSMMMQPW